MSDYDPTRTTRRAALRLIGTTAAATGLTTAATAQDNDTENETESSEETGEESEESDQRPIILSGRAEYWYGIAPEEIEGEENPALDLEEGTEYELVWINADGAEHNLIVESEDGEDLETSDDSEEAGEAVSMTFEASEDAAEYYCEYHPEDMRGDVELGEGFDLEAHSHEEHQNESETESDGNSSE